MYHFVNPPGLKWYCADWVLEGTQKGILSLYVWRGWVNGWVYSKRMWTQAADAHAVLLILHWVSAYTVVFTHWCVRWSFHTTLMGILIKESKGPSRPHACNKYNLGFKSVFQDKVKKNPLRSWSQLFSTLKISHGGYCLFIPPQLHPGFRSFHWIWFFCGANWQRWQHL